MSDLSERAIQRFKESPNMKTALEAIAEIGEIYDRHSAGRADCMASIARLALELENNKENNP